MVTPGFDGKIRQILSGYKQVCGYHLLDELPAGLSATDLVSGQSFDRGSVLGLAPGASYVPYLEE